MSYGRDDNGKEAHGKRREDGRGRGARRQVPGLERRGAHRVPRADGRPAVASCAATLRGNATFTVTKNTLAKVAATEAGLGDQVESLLSGPSAIAFVDGDVAQAAKGLLDFAKANPLLVIKGGVLDGKALTAAEVGKLADLEPREVLLAKLAGAMKASMAGAAATFNALPTQMALLADALRAKVEAGTAERPGGARGGRGGGGGTAAPDTQTETQD